MRGCPDKRPKIFLPNFGELEQTLGLNIVSQHTGISLSWPLVKVFIYFMQVHLLSHERTHGRVLVPKGVIVPFPPSASAVGVSEEDYAKGKQLYDYFMAANPEAKS